MTPIGEIVVSEKGVYMPTEKERGSKVIVYFTGSIAPISSTMALPRQWK